MISLIELNIIEKVFPFKQWNRFVRKKITLEFIAIGLLIYSLAGPQIGRKLRQIKTHGSNIFILVDCSDSMVAEDFKPNRMGKSKRILSGILEKCAGHKVGIIAFSGEPYVYCPLTFDSSAVKQFLKSIEPGMIPQPGTKIGSAVRLALEKLTAGEGAHSIVLLSDGEDHNSDPIKAAEEAKEKGVRIFTIGIGNPEGEPIPVKDANGNIVNYKKDRKGEVVLSRLDESMLAQLSLITGGSYFRASDSEQEIDLLTQKLLSLEKGTSSKKENVYENRYQWFLVIAFILLLYKELIDFLGIGLKQSYLRTESRKIAFLIILFSFLFLSYSKRPSYIYADSFAGDMKKGNKFYHQKKYSEALKQYEQAAQSKPSDLRGNFNKGTALYKLQETEKASEEFERSSFSQDTKLAAKSFFNLGNSQFQNGKYSEAIRSYKQCLKLDSTDKDAKFNLELALQIMKNLPPSQQNESQGKKNESKSEKKKGQQEKER
ncbi:MAG: VWA domain-containing protein, partial [Elusimicrobia bacterium]|nr:VWA domain-containing protein [Candidatus Obscuribacterium magneticum]